MSYQRYIDIKCDPLDPKWCPIILGNSIVCDGYYVGKTTSIFTHFHIDHIKNFTRTFTNCSYILLSEITLDALKSITNSSLNRANIHALKYGRKFHTDKGESIELLDANHVAGSSQVLVEMEEDGTKILYSGDFCFPNIQVPKCDYLVLAGEHGTKNFDYDTDKPSILNRIFDKIYEEIINGVPVEIRANTGTMQDILECLSREHDGKFIPEAVPFLTNKKHICLTDAISKSYKTNLRELQEDKDFILDELFIKHQPYIRFATVGTVKPQEDRGIVIQADVNQEFGRRGPFFSIDQHRWFACLSAHSSFSNILKYVDQADPQFIIVDGSRASNSTADNLAKTITDKFGKPARMIG